MRSKRLTIGGAVLCALLTSAAAVWSANAAGETGATFQRSMIWIASASVGKQVYVAFRKRFDVTGPPQAAALHIFADSRYLLWVNGQYVNRGPCRFDPKAPEYDSLDVTDFVKRGANAVAVLVQHYHDGTDRTDGASLNGRIMRHTPGLGVRPGGAVAGKRLIIQPHLGDLESVAGVVVTEFGPVPVSWKRNDGRNALEFQFTVPTGVKAAVSFPKVGERSALEVDGQTLVLAGASASTRVTASRRYFQMELGEGNHTGQLTWKQP